MATNDWNLTQFLSKNSAALKRLVGAGVEVLEFPNDVWDAFGEATTTVLGENMDDDLFKQVHDSAMESQRSTSDWLASSSGAFVAQRKRIFG